MTRAFLALALAGWLCAQQAPPKPPPPEPPEEDESLIEKEYAFNPLQAAKELEVGNYYFKRGSFPAAAKRFDEATKWNPQFAEAYYRLGEAREKVASALKGDAVAAKRTSELASARAAYAKFLEVAPEDRRAATVKKKLDAWK